MFQHKLVSDHLLHSVDTIVPNLPMWRSGKVTDQNHGLDHILDLSLLNIHESNQLLQFSIPIQHHGSRMRVASLDLKGSHVQGQLIGTIDVSMNNRLVVFNSLFQDVHHDLDLRKRQGSCSCQDDIS